MIMHLLPGNLITPKRALNPTMISHWRHASECADILGGLLPGAVLKIVEVSIVPGDAWVRAGLPGRHPPAFLKISGEEFSWNFRLV